jgi:hypothetical protein
VSASTGPILAAGAITLFNDLVINRKSWQQDSRVIVGTAVAAGGLYLVEQISPELARGIAWIALVTVLFVRTDPKVPSPAEAFNTWYNAK